MQRLPQVKFLTKEAFLEIGINYGFTFKEGMDINLDEKSNIYRSFESNNYKGIYGKINKFSLSDPEGKQHIICNYVDKREETVMLVYKGKQSIFLIIVNSEKPINEDVISWFNLN
jgi:hypothetical protein